MTEHPPIEYRGRDEGVEVVGVSFPKRQIEVVVMPYETETVVSYRGRRVREIVARGAFNGIENKPSKVHVNRDHDSARLCGKAVSFRPSRDEGLVAELRMSNTDLGTETLELANDGILGASAGFWPWLFDDGTVGEEWPERDLRRLTKISLDHVAMTPSPAYPTAEVLAVRNAAPVVDGGGPTPNLDFVRALLRQEEYARISSQNRQP